jgi:hypothetical protein
MISVFCRQAVITLPTLLPPVPPTSSPLVSMSKSRPEKMRDVMAGCVSPTKYILHRLLVAIMILLVSSVRGVEDWKRGKLFLLRGLRWQDRIKRQN